MQTVSPDAEVPLGMSPAVLVDPAAQAMQTADETKKSVGQEQAVSPSVETSPAGLCFGEIS
jgi:hypothetical protein